MRKPASNTQLSGVDFSPFIGGQFQVRERCLCKTLPMPTGSIRNFRPKCSASVLQGEVSKVQVAGIKLITYLNWWAKNEGCPGQLSPYWEKCKGSVWPCDITGAKILSVDDPLPMLIQLDFTDREVIFFPKGYEGKSYGGLVRTDQVATVSVAHKQ